MKTVADVVENMRRRQLRRERGEERVGDFDSSFVFYSEEGLRPSSLGPWLRSFQSMAKFNLSIRRTDT